MEIVQRLRSYLRIVWVLGLTLVTISHVQAATVPGECEGKMFPSADWVRSQNAFAWKYFQAQAKSKDTSAKNFDFSPASLSNALQMILLGTSGEAAQEIIGALEAQGLATNQLMPNARQMIDKFAHLEGGLRVRVANSLWTDQSFNFAPSYLEQLKPLGPHLLARSRNFHDEKTLAEINGWVQEMSKVVDHSSGKEVSLINQALERLAPNDVFVLLSTLLVDGFWQHELEDEAWLTFLGETGKPYGIKAAAGVIDVPHLENKDFEIISMPFRDSRIVVDFVMPKVGADSQKLLSEMTSERYNDVLAGLKIKSVQVKIPKLDITTKVDLSSDPVFRKVLGVNRIFNAGSMIPMGSEKLYISQARHDSHVKVTGLGYQGFSVTTFVGGLESMVMAPKFETSFVADRPFWMIVRDVRDNQILRMSRVEEATDKTGYDTSLSSADRVKLQPATLETVRAAVLAKNEERIVAALSIDPLFSEHLLSSLAAARVAVGMLSPQYAGQEDFQKIFYEELSAVYDGKVPARAAAPQNPIPEAFAPAAHQIKDAGLAEFVPIDAPVRIQLRKFFKEVSPGTKHAWAILNGILMTEASLRAILLPGEMVGVARELKRAHRQGQNPDQVLDERIPPYLNRESEEMDKLVITEIERMRESAHAELWRIFDLLYYNNSKTTDLETATIEELAHGLADPDNRAVPTLALINYELRKLKSR